MTTRCVQACGLKSLAGYSIIETRDIWEESVTTKSETLTENIPRVLVYKRRSDIKEVDIMEFRVCNSKYNLGYFQPHPTYKLNWMILCSTD